jgi:hypothetical protein
MSKITPSINKRSIDDLYKLFNRHEETDRVMFQSLSNELKYIKYIGYYLAVFVTGRAVVMGTGI